MGESEENGNLSLSSIKKRRLIQKYETEKQMYNDTLLLFRIFLKITRKYKGKDLNY